MGKSTVLVIEDNSLMRSGIQTLLDESLDLGFTQVPVDSDIEQSLDHLKPDLVLFGLPITRARNETLLKRIAERRVRVLVFSSEDEFSCAEAALRAGARGYLMNSEPPERLLEAARTVIAGNLYLSDTMKSRFLRRIADNGSL